MCDPMTIGAATAALTVGESVMTHIGTNQAYGANRAAANLDYANRWNVVQQQTQQLDTERSEAALDTAISGIQAEGRIAASASDLGMAPTSFISNINAEMFGLGRQAAVDDVNDRNTRNQLGNEIAGAQVARQSKINSAPKSSGFALALGVGKAAAQGFSAYQGAGGRT